MRFHIRQHRHYGGIDLHVKTMYVCILDSTGQVLVHRNVRSRRSWRPSRRIATICETTMAPIFTLSSRACLPGTPRGSQGNPDGVLPRDEIPLKARLQRSRPSAA